MNHPLPLLLSDINSTNQITSPLFVGLSQYHHAVAQIEQTSRPSTNKATHF